MGTEQSKLKKLKWFKVRFLGAEELGISLDEEKLISEFVITHASTRRTALEILKT